MVRFEGASSPSFDPSDPVGEQLAKIIYEHNCPSSLFGKKPSQTAALLASIVLEMHQKITDERKSNEENKEYAEYLRLKLKYEEKR